MASSFIGKKGWSGAFAARFARAVMQWRFPILGLTLVLVLAAGLGIKRLNLSDDYKVWFSKDNSDLKAFEMLSSTYSPTDSILFVLAPKDGDVFTRKTLEDIQWLTKESWKVPFTTRVDSLSNFQRTEAKKDDLKVRDLVQSPMTLTSPELMSIRNYALSEPSLVKQVVSAKGHVAAVNVTITLPGKAPTENADAVAYARKLKAQLLARDPNLKIYLTGLVVMNATDPELSSADMKTLIPLMYLILMVALGLMLRTVSGVLATLLTITFAIVVSMGVGGWLNYPLTVLAAIAPVVVMTLAISDSVHVLVTFYQQMRRGKSKSSAIYSAIVYNLYPSSFTSLANFVGYASMNLLESPPFGQFGNIVAVGSIAELALAFLFVPSLLSVLPIRVSRTASSKTKETKLEAGLASLVLRHRSRLIVGLAAVTVIFGAFVRRNEINDDFMKYYAERTEFRKDTDFTDKNLTGVLDMQYSLNAGGAGGIYRPDFLKKVEAFTHWYRQQPEVDSVTSITDVIKRINKSMHGDHAEWYRIPESQKLAAQYFLLYDMSLPYGMSLTNLFNQDKSSTRVIVRLKIRTTKEMMALDARAKNWLRSNVSLSWEKGSYSASYTMMFCQIITRMMKGMIESFLLSFAIISLLLMLLFRSVKVGILSLVPNLIPAVMAFGLWGLAQGKIGMPLATVCCTTLGIVVDSTIHFFNHYLAGRRQYKLSPEQSVHHAFSRAGTAIFVTDTLLIIGFGVLVLSPYAMNFVMGQMTALTLLFDVVVTLLLSAPLILLFDRGAGRSGGSMLERLIDGNLLGRTNPKRRRSASRAMVVAFLLVSLGPRGLASTAQTITPEERGLEIAKKAKAREAGFHDYAADIKMTVKNASGSSSVSRLRMSFLETPGDGDKALATFLEPGDVKGTSLLTYSHKKGEDDQWLYLPELTRVKRISSTNKSGPFMGSEFAYEDMTYHEVEKFSYRFLREEKCDLGMCYVVERRPKNPESGYSKQEVYWDTKLHREVQIKYFDRKGELLKIQKDLAMKEYLNHWWIPARMEMTNVQTRKSTVIEWSNIRFRIGLAARDFDTNSLSRAR